MRVKHHPQSRQNDIVIQELGGEVLIYDLKINKAFCLNDSSALIWRLCDGSRNITEITNEAAKKIKSKITEEYTFLALEQLRENNLITHDEQLPQNFKGLSRREVIRRIGLATMATLPVITSLAAPSALSAASGGVGLFQQCTGTTGTQGNCAAGLVCCEDVLISNPYTCQPADPISGACDSV